MSAAQEPFPVRVLTHREQAALQREWIETRFDTLLPDLMRRSGIDMWLIVSREYDDDPVFRSMAPVTTYSSRRRTILVFIDRGGTLGVERLSIGRFDYDGLYTLVKTHNDGQWEGLRQLVEQRDPATIGINTSELFSHADGLSSSEKSALIEALGAKYAARLRSAEALAVGWLEVKLRGETEAYRLAVRIAHEIIAEAFSSRVIAPGVSTTGDVVWWMRQRVASLGLGQWFQPSVTIWRQGGVAQPPPPEGHVIERGDFLHCDFGIVYLGFSTDTQQNAYVLRTGETDAPAGLRAGLRDAGRLQDITMQCARAGVSGNAALSCALAQARREGLAPSIYCHPIGYHGHGAGPPIGMTDYQDGVPGRGEYLLRAATWHSIELNVTHAVPEWGNEQIRVALEEDAALLDEGWSWIDGRQTALHLIR
jgi:Xaa-Pro aminopeptidase